MPRFFLELHQGDLLPGLLGRPGAANYAPGPPDLYWAVLVGEPQAGSLLADFFAPEGPTGTAGAISHGNDSADARSTSVTIRQAGAWRPKYPPYDFEVTAPDGTLIRIAPPGGGDDALIFFVPCSIANGLGIWTVRAFPCGVPNTTPNTPGGMTRVPEIIDDRRAALNPDDLDFDPAGFLRQPLLILDAEAAAGGGGGGACPDFDGEITTSGCAPGRVGFSAQLTGSAADIEEVTWDFGDGEFEEQLAPPFSSPLTASHNYAAVPSEPASLTVRRRAGCSPRTISSTVDVPSCGCPSIGSLEVTDGCVPGRVSFRLSVLGTLTDVVRIVWTWGDGGEQSFEGANLGDGLAPSHLYTDVPPSDVTVTLILPDNCPPGVDTAAVDLPRCDNDVPLCPRLDGIEVRGCAGNDEDAIFTALGTNLGLARDFEWDFGDGTVRSSGANVAHSYNRRAEHTVRVTMTSPAGCQPQEQTASARVPACGETIGPPLPACLVFYVLFWIFLIASIILLLVAFCPPPVNVPVLVAAIGCCLFTLIFLYLWLNVCGRNTCNLLNAAILILTIVTPLWDFFVGVVGYRVPCAVPGAWSSGLFLTLLSGALYWIALATGCLVQNNNGDPSTSQARMASRQSSRFKSRPKLCKCGGCGGHTR